MKRYLYDLTKNNISKELLAEFTYYDIDGNEVNGIYHNTNDVSNLLDNIGYLLTDDNYHETKQIQDTINGPIDTSKPIIIKITHT